MPRSCCRGFFLGAPSAGNGNALGPQARLRSWLAVALNKVGDMQKAQGDLAAALTSYRDNLAIIGWRNPIPATPAGSAICLVRMTGSATRR